MTQSIIQAWARSISGSAGQVNEDLHAAFDVLGVPLGQINERAMAYTGMSTASAAWLALSGDNADFALNFLSGILDPRITFTRASTATYTGSDGLLKTAASGEARFDYDPVTLACRGLLMEEARTNLCTTSTSVVPNTGTTGATDAPNMFGAANSSVTLTESAASSIHLAFTGVSASWTAATVYACTVYITPGTATRAQVLFTTASALSTVNDYANFSLVGEGAVLATGSSSTARIRRIGGTNVYACTVQLTAGATLVAAAPFVAFINSDTAARAPSYLGTGLTMVVHGSQVEVGTFPTSYIPTAGAAVLRQPDSALVTGTNFSGWYNQAEGSFVADAFTTVDATSARRLFGVTASAANVNDALHVLRETASQSSARSAVAGVADFNPVTTATFAATGPSKVAFAYTQAGPTTKKIVLNGGTVATSAVAISTSPMIQLDLGSSLGSSQHICGSLRRLSYYARALPDTTLQSLTAA